MTVRAPSPYAQTFERMVEQGHCADLLPVVWDQRAPISSISKLRAIGKTPSLISNNGQVVGVLKWTERRTTEEEIQRWSADARIGVAMQTRKVRALDIDVEDASNASHLANIFEAVVGIKLPRRGRPNSGKILLAFEVVAPLSKRVLKFSGGLVELLATGQQFVVDSVHPSGVPYTWDTDQIGPFPRIGLVAFEAAWQTVVNAVGAESNNTTPPSSRAHFDADARVSWLTDNWETFGFGRRGQLLIRCPFEGGHSMESGETECAYLPSGTNGHAVGHYKCFHASCANRSTADFDHATGYQPCADEPDGINAPHPPFTLTGSGKIESTVSNLCLALEQPDFSGVHMSFDSFLGEVQQSPDASSWTRLQDEDLTRLLVGLERKGFARIRRQDLRDCVNLVAHGRSRDSAQTWLTALEWDGQGRVSHFLTTYFGSAPGAYTEAVSTYWWTAHAARVLFPGCQVDMVPVLVSPEGRHKSTSLQSLVPEPDHFAEIDLQHRDTDLSRLMRGKLLGEIAELRGLKSRGVEAIKAFVTRRIEEWTPKYKESNYRYQRRLVFIGTTNEAEFLSEATGERRWLPILIGDGRPKELAAAREQLWAEAAHIVLERVKELLDPVTWEEVTRLAPEQRAMFTTTDPWRSLLVDWLDSVQGRSAATEGFSLTIALEQAIRLTPAQMSPAAQSRAAQILRSLGCSQDRPRASDRRRLWKWAGEAERRARVAPLVPLQIDLTAGEQAVHGK